MVCIEWLLSWCGQGTLNEGGTGGRSVTPLSRIGAAAVRELSCARGRPRSGGTKPRPVFHRSHTNDRCPVYGGGPIVQRDRVFSSRQRRSTVVESRARASRIQLPGRRFSWPLMLLLASVAVTAVAAFNAQRAVWSHQRTASRLLRDYASFTAWTSQRQVIGTLEGAVMASLQYIMHGRDLHENTRYGPVPNADDLWRYFNNQERSRTRFCTRKSCPESFAPSVYFGFTLGSDTLRVAPRAATPEADAWLEVAPQGDRQWLVDSLTTHV